MTTITYYDEQKRNKSNINNNNIKNHNNMKKISGFTIALLGLGTASLVGFLGYRKVSGVWKNSNGNADGESKKPQEKTKGENDKVPVELGKTSDNVGTGIKEGVGEVLNDEINYLASGNWNIEMEFKKIIFFMITKKWKSRYSRVYKMEDFYKEFTDIIVRSDFMFNTEAMTYLPKDFGGFKEFIGRRKIARRINIFLLENRQRLEYDARRVVLERIDRPRREFRPLHDPDNLVEITLTVRDEEKVQQGGGRKRR